MKPMIGEVGEGEEIISFFFVPDPPQVKQARNKDYLCIKLQDKTATIDGRLWEYQKGFDPSSIKKKSFVKVQGRVVEWNDQKQLKISQIRLVNESDSVDLEDFFAVSPRPPEEMFYDLTMLVDEHMSSGSPICLLTLGILFANKENLLKAPAAKSVHNAYIGGLLEHVISMSKASIGISDHYKLNKELMLAACILHDIGKIFELTFPIGIGYSLEGTLLGHITIGVDMVSKEMDKIPNFPYNTRVAILHLIVSHHGLLEYGSPKIPLMREAIAFHLIDMLDSRLFICEKALKGEIDEDGLTAWVKELEGPLWKGLA